MRLVTALSGRRDLRRRRLKQRLSPAQRNPAYHLIAREEANATANQTLDVLGAQTEGMIGYLIEQELDNILPPGKSVASLLTRVLVDQHDAAFKNPTKFVGPIFDRETANESRADKTGSFGRMECIGVVSCHLLLRWR